MHKDATTGVAVVKLGGRAAQDAGVLAGIGALIAGGKWVVAVHGGGVEVDAALEQRGIATPRIGGLRTTDVNTLAVTEAVLCGTVNKRLVRAALAAGLTPVGLSGQDAALLTAARTPDSRLGLVGTAPVCTPTLLLHLLRDGYLPIVAPLALATDGHTALNVNADHAAAAIAVALRAQQLLFVTDVPHVRREVADPHSAIAHMTSAEARAFAPCCEGGMRPKLEAASTAVDGGVNRCVIGSAEVLAGIGTYIGTPAAPAG